MSLKFDEIVSVAGKSGLFKVLKPTKNGYIVEELNDSRKKLVLGPNHRVSLLKEISIYTTDAEGAVPLRDVYEKIYKKYKADLPVSAREEKDELFDFLADIVPDFDSEKVYQSDVKKLVSWYNTIITEDPEISFKEDKETKSGEPKEVAETKKSTDTKAKPKKAPKVSNQVSSSKKGGPKPSANRKMG